MDVLVYFPQKIAFLSLLLATFFLPVSGFTSDRFSQTTANPDTSVLQIRLGDNWFEINLETPGIKIKRYPNGTLQELFVQMVNVSYYIQFFPTKPYTSERIAVIKRYQSFADANGERMLLHGKTESYDENSHLISEINWDSGYLHGTYRMYNEYFQLTEERCYDTGFPINTWTIYYSNGKKAKEITFPSRLIEWQNSRLEGSNPDEGHLASVDYYHPMKIKETFYSLSGRRQKERFLQIMEYGTGFQVIPTNEELIYDLDGKVVMEKTPHPFYDSEKSEYDSYGRVYFQERFWIDSQLFKESSLDIPEKTSK